MKYKLNIVNEILVFAKNSILDAEYILEKKDIYKKSAEETTSLRYQKEIFQEKLNTIEALLQNEKNLDYKGELLDLNLSNLIKQANDFEIYKKENHTAYLFKEKEKLSTRFVIHKLNKAVFFLDTLSTNIILIKKKPKKSSSDLSFFSKNDSGPNITSKTECISTNGDPRIYIKTMTPKEIRSFDEKHKYAPS